MVDYSNAWPNYYVGFLWLAVFIAFAVMKYPHGKKKEGTNHELDQVHSKHRQ